MKTNDLFKGLSIEDEKQLFTFSRKAQLSIEKLKYYNDNTIFPSGNDLIRILDTSGITELELKLMMGILDGPTLEVLKANSRNVARSIYISNEKTVSENHSLAFKTDLGQMFKGDCVSLMSQMDRESVDLIFADPPFNLNKNYESGMNDKVETEEYLKWTEQWVKGCIDLLKYGGSMFVWNIPKWNTHIAGILNRYLTFKNWIAVDIKYRLPIKNRLYPSHYSLLYYTKGEKANVFNEQRLPLESCRHCGGDIRDYGGYKDKLNISGINLTDVWYDIPPVRHSKYKTRESNELSLKLLERIISLASKEGDLIFDPFGGSGTTYIVAEILNRLWIGVELGDIDLIEQRFKDIESHCEYIEKIRCNKNRLITEGMRKLRLKNGHWLPETLKCAK